MISSLLQARQHLCEVFRSGKLIALFFDFDGTLSPIVEHPDMAGLDEHVVKLLTALADLVQVKLAIVSGRRLDEIRKLVPVPKINFAGTSGLEIECQGILIRHPRAAHGERIIAELISELQKPIAYYTGAWIENKTLGLTVHYRQVEASQHAAMHTSIQSILHQFSQKIHVVSGPLAVEITPNLGWGKETAVKIMLEKFGVSGNCVLYAGDGENDAEAFKTVVDMGGICIGVGDKAAAMTAYNVPNPHGLHIFLDLLYQALSDPP